MNSAQTQTAWLVLLFAALLSALALGLAGISAAESLAAAQVTTDAASGASDGRAEFLVWGAGGALIAFVAMRWLRGVPSETPRPKRLSQS